jgi:hypothetical protein
MSTSRGWYTLFAVNVTLTRINFVNKGIVAHRVGHFQPAYPELLAEPCMVLCNGIHRNEPKGVSKIAVSTPQC